MSDLELVRVLAPIDISFQTLWSLDQQALDECFAVGAPAYLTENYSINWRLTNGSKVIMHSLTFEEGVHDEMKALMDRAQPDSITVLPYPPLFVNVEVPESTVGELYQHWPYDMNLNNHVVQDG